MKTSARRWPCRVSSSRRASLRSASGARPIITARGARSPTRTDCHRRRRSRSLNDGPKTGAPRSPRRQRDMTQPLEGLLVLDFSTLLPGPMATLLLGEAGAEVIKIERPGTGDEMRSYEPRLGDQSTNFALLNRGKRSIALDLKSEAGHSRL